MPKFPVIFFLTFMLAKGMKSTNPHPTVCLIVQSLSGGQGVGENATKCRGNFSSGAKQDDSKQGLASSDPYSLIQ
jgi:hypothetical protein